MTRVKSQEVVCVLRVACRAVYCRRNQSILGVCVCERDGAAVSETERDSDNMSVCVCGREIYTLMVKYPTI